RDPLVEELLPLGHEVGRRRGSLRHHLGPGRHALIHEGSPESLRIHRRRRRGRALPHHPQPGLRPLLDLALPHVEQLLARVVGHDVLPRPAATTARPARTRPSASNAPRPHVRRSARCPLPAPPLTPCPACPPRR